MYERSKSWGNILPGLGEITVRRSSSLRIQQALTRDCKEDLKLWDDLLLQGLDVWANSVTGIADLLLAMLLQSAWGLDPG